MIFSILCLPLVVYSSKLTAQIYSVFDKTFEYQSRIGIFNSGQGGQMIFELILAVIHSPILADMSFNVPHRVSSNILNSKAFK